MVMLRKKFFSLPQRLHGTCNALKKDATKLIGFKQKENKGLTIGS